MATGNVTRRGLFGRAAAVVVAFVAGLWSRPAPASESFMEWPMSTGGMFFPPEDMAITVRRPNGDNDGKFTLFETECCGAVARTRLDYLPGGKFRLRGWRTDEWKRDRLVLVFDREFDDFGEIGRWSGAFHFNQAAIAQATWGR